MPQTGMTGIYPDIPTETRPILEAGISIFQMILGRRYDHDQKYYGPVNCKVTSDDPEDIQVMRKNMHVQWFTGRDAHIRFVVDNQRTAICWAPDDMFWHNRVCFMETPDLRKSIVQLRNPDNSVISGAEALMEIEVLEQELKYWRDGWRVTRDGRPYDDSYRTKDLAQAFVNSLGTGKINIGPDGQLKTERQLQHVYAVEPIKIYEFKVDIQELMAREGRRNRFGWTECKKFMEDIKPRVLEKIREKRKLIITQQMPETPQVNAEAVVDALMNATPEYKAKIRALLLGEAPVPAAVYKPEANPVPESQDEIAETPAQEPEVKAPKPKKQATLPNGAPNLTRLQLSAMPLSELRQHCQTHFADMDITNVPKVVLVDKILTEQKKYLKGAA